MDRWLAAALDYILAGSISRCRYRSGRSVTSPSPPRQPGAERAFGTANLGTGEALTPRHRFRVASHSKSFTAAGIMKLREQRKLKLDDAAGDYVEGLHRDVARATIAQLLSHTAGHHP